MAVALGAALLADDGGGIPADTAAVHWWYMAPARHGVELLHLLHAAAHAQRAGGRPATYAHGSSDPPTCWIRIMLVVPEMPTGTPAVMTTKIAVADEARLLYDYANASSSVFSALRAW